MFATSRSAAPPAEPVSLAGCAETHGAISDLLGRCDALRDELEQLHTEHAALLRTTEDIRHAYQAERQCRVQHAHTALGLLSALNTPTPTLVAPSQPAAPAHPREWAA
jgi:hypothetical protein